jgi:hypothetical protein
MPRLTSETIGGGDQSWLGSAHGIGNCRTATIDVSAFTAGTHYPNGYIPSGLPVDVADEGAAAPWTGGEGEVLGFVFTDQPCTATTADFAAPILRHGLVKVDNLPIAFTVVAAPGFAFIEVAGGGS